MIWDWKSGSERVSRELASSLAHISEEASLRAFHVYFYFSLFCPSLNRHPGKMGFWSYLKLKYLPEASHAESYKYFPSPTIAGSWELGRWPLRGENGLFLMPQGWGHKRKWCPEKDLNGSGNTVWAFFNWVMPLVCLWLTPPPLPHLVPPWLLPPGGLEIVHIAGEHPEPSPALGSPNPF